MDRILSIVQPTILCYHSRTLILLAFTYFRKLSLFSVMLFTLKVAAQFLEFSAYQSTQEYHQSE